MSSVQLPLASVNTTPPPVTGNIIQVHSGGNLQAAINAAQPGDEIVLDAGAVFTGPITLAQQDGLGMDHDHVVRCGRVDARRSSGPW